MRKLGKTISALARYRRHWSTLLQSTGATHATAPSAAASHLTELTGFGSNPGALRMFTYVPKNLKSSALVVVLHGCTQSAGTYDLGAGWSTLAERYGFVLLFPEQTPANNPKTCFNWFLPGDIAEVLVYDAPLTPNDCKSISTWLGNKYGIAVDGDRSIKRTAARGN